MCLNLCLYGSRAVLAVVSGFQVLTIEGLFLVFALHPLLQLERPSFPHLLLHLHPHSLLAFAYQPLAETKTEQGHPWTFRFNGLALKGLTKSIVKCNLTLI